MATEKETLSGHQSLGELLRSERIRQELEIRDIIEETRISELNLRAMEDDNYGILPALAFSKGLYAIYAKKLNLDTDLVISKLVKESAQTSIQTGYQQTPSRLIKEISGMAERPPAPPTPIIGGIILLFIAVLSLLCWYYSINPATYLSKKLRGLQKPTSSSGMNSGCIPGNLFLNSNNLKISLNSFQETEKLLTIPQYQADSNTAS